MCLTPKYFMVADGKMIKDRFGIKTELKFDAILK